MSEEPPYILDVDSLNAEHPRDGSPGVGRPWIGVHFECCGVYLRLYRNRQGTAYTGRCPVCLSPVSVRIGPGGTHERMFRAR